MAEEEKQDTEETAEPEAAEEAPSEAPAEEAAEGEAAEASDEVAEGTAEPASTPEPGPAGNVAEGEASGEVVPEASGVDGEAEQPAADTSDAPPAPTPAAEPLGPKARRRLQRSRASGPAAPPRTAEQRVAERTERRGAAKQRRRRYRLVSRQKSGEAGTGTPPAAREPGPKKVRQGRVVSAGGDKTITVEIAVVRRDSTYEKVVRRTSKVRAHDEANQAQQGDVVRVIESRPISRTKRWRLVEVLEKAR
jgi:small subunit ribosomal protein S17